MTLSPENWPRLREVFAGALALAADERPAYLADACGTDRALRLEVESLLASHSLAHDFLEAPAGTPVSLVGRRLGGYSVGALLGVGGMGEVYRAHDEQLHRDVAIKILPPLFAHDPGRLARFEHEARMLAALNHPHIGAIYGLENVDGSPALVLELVEGETLADRLARGPLPLRDALAVTRQIADALDSAHEKGIVHRDLKPANIKITPAGVVKVLDFGLAKAAVADAAPAHDSWRASGKATSDTRVGAILGTAAYMSPEQARGLEVDTRADIWAFGCVLYETLTGRPPFTGQTATDTRAGVLEGEPDWKALPAATPSIIRALLRRCLHKDRARRLQNIKDARTTIDQSQRGWNWWRVASVAAAAVAALTIAGAYWLAPARPADRSQWIQLTMLPDSVIHPALSPDGRMLAFVRAQSSAVVPFSPGQVYVKTLPDGEPVQLTNDGLQKMSPVFSPDGKRIAYATVDGQFAWDTWTVAASGGKPERWLDNASGLSWTGLGQVLFAEMRKTPHMGIVAADESRRRRHDVYVPAHAQGMAHLSYASPDGRWVLLTEMDRNHAWTPCRLVPVDGTSQGRLVGPPGACTFGAWSPDGRWMYLTSNAGGSNHIWRQRFPDGEPEQITSGPTEEEGIAVAPDGRSLVTAVALRNTSVWLHDQQGERQISVEGNAVDAKFTPDGKKLLYKIVSSLGAYPSPGVLRVADLASGRSEVLAPGLQTIDYSVSRDGRQVVMEVADPAGVSRLWLAGLDGQTTPRQIPNLEGKQPRFGVDGDIVFRRQEGAATFVSRVRPDGTELRRVVEQPVPQLGEISPDGRWIAGWSAIPDTDVSAVQLFSLAGSLPPVTIGAGIFVNWSSSGDSVSVSGRPVDEGHSYLIPLQPGDVLPPMPAAGLQSDGQVAQLQGARRVDAMTVPGPSIGVYAFYRSTTLRNLYRVPIS